MDMEFQNGVLSTEQKQQFIKEGFLILKGLFQPEEVACIRDLFMDIQAKGRIPGYFEPAAPHEAKGDPLLLYPRILYPHRILDTAKKYMLDARIMEVLAGLFEEEPLAAQSMFYFKPPGARGQALHQDNYYLRAEPGTCIAAWTAIDKADQENGGLMVVPKTQNMEIRCPQEADPAQSFTRDLVTAPKGSLAVPVNMDPGDVLFFNGSTIHGSHPNQSKYRFRRSFICHYVGASTLRLGHHIHDDLYNSRGEVISVNQNDRGGPCGTEFEGVPH
jgi:ectoine hydroxylase-related dioxygenase (phytanoyl-CoA dioxygenase family)